MGMLSLAPLERPAGCRRIARFTPSLSVTMMAGTGKSLDAEGLIDAIAQRRDRAAFGELFAYYAPRAKAYLVRRGATAELAEELAQETMLVVWRKASMFDADHASASAWIFTIARNLRIDQLRRDRPMVGENEIPDQQDTRPLSDQVIDAAQRSARLRAALATLPPEQAEVVRLSFFDDRPHAEIERALEIPLGTVKSRLRLAVAKLRNLLEGDQ
jgi:RNA polymerase sigma-70 factor, ECF subfamily